MALVMLKKEYRVMGEHRSFFKAVSKLGWVVCGVRDVDYRRPIKRDLDGRSILRVALIG